MIDGAAAAGVTNGSRHAPELRMPLQSKTFIHVTALENCLKNDADHITKGADGEHVKRIQDALFALNAALIDKGELDAKKFGNSTADAVLAYKSRQGKEIVNRTYQNKPDAIVGKMTIHVMDQELLALEGNLPNPLTDPNEEKRIQALLDKERPGVTTLLTTVLASLAECQTSFLLVNEDPAKSVQLEFKNRFTVDGLRRFFGVDRQNFRFFLPQIIRQYQAYQAKLSGLRNDQQAADFAKLQAKFPAALKNGQVTADTPAAFSDKGNAMVFTVRYREFNPNMPPVFSGLFPEALRGIQLHEMGHFYFDFLDGNPTGKQPQERMKLAGPWDLTARQAAFRHFISL
jgi:hypothetical protein